jgi:hypothetical protein
MSGFRESIVTLGSNLGGAAMSPTRTVPPVGSGAGGAGVAGADAAGAEAVGEAGADEDSGAAAEDATGAAGVGAGAEAQAVKRRSGRILMVHRP